MAKYIVEFKSGKYGDFQSLEDFRTADTEEQAVETIREHMRDYADIALDDLKEEGPAYRVAVVDHYLDFVPPRDKSTLRRSAA